MKTKTAKVLPKTVDEIFNGGVYLQRVRCGKQNCKCARGETHSAYYFFTRRCGKLIKIYIRKADVKAFTEMANQAISQRKRSRAFSRESNELLKRLRQSNREYQLLMKVYKQNYKNEQK